MLAALPVSPELRADPGAVGERSGALAAAAVEHVVEGASPGPPRSGEDLSLRLGDVRRDAGARLPRGRSGRGRGVRARGARQRSSRTGGSTGCAPARTSCRATCSTTSSDLRPPIGATHPLRVAEAVTRLGGSPLEEATVEALEPQLLHLLEPSGAVSRAHEDPDPVRRVARRILQRLDGMGKWGSYHTAFDHLARGFAGHERALAYEVGESLVAAGLLEEKPSVGQRHVYLSPRRSGDIRRLIDEGELPRRPRAAAYAGLTRRPPSGSTLSARRPSTSSFSSSPTSSRRQPCATRSSSPCSPRRSEPTSADSSAWVAISSTATPDSIERWRTSACASETSGASAGSRADGSSAERRRLARLAALDRREQRVAAAVERLRRQAADLLEPALVGRRAARELDERLVGQHRPRRAVRAARLVLAPLGELEGHAARGLAQPAEPGEALVGAARVALVAHLLERARLLASPLEPAPLREAPLELVAEREQHAGVVGRVLELLRRQRAPVPAREALAPAQPNLQDLADERLVALLVAEAEEAGGHLGVEDVAHLGVERPAQDRHVLAPGVHHDLDRRVGEHARQRREVRVALERVDHLGPDAVLGIRVGHRDLHQAEQRLVAALGHELRVDCNAPALGGAVR